MIEVKIDVFREYKIVASTFLGARSGQLNSKVSMESSKSSYIFYVIVSMVVIVLMVVFDFCYVNNAPINVFLPPQDYMGLQWRKKPF